VTPSHQYFDEQEYILSHKTKHSTMVPKIRLFLIFLLTLGWTSRSSAFHLHAAPERRRFAAKNEKAISELSEGLPAAAEMQPFDPCWQHMMDSDCTMDHIYSAHFVAGKWIKSMPCGEGIQVSRPWSLLFLAPVILGIRLENLILVVISIGL
jgi:hypothetical protein